VGRKHEPTSAKVEAPGPRNGVLVGNGQKGRARGTDPDLNEFGVLEYELTHDGRTSLTASFPERGSLGATRTGAAAMLSSMGGSAFGFSGARTAGSIRVIRTGLRLELLVSRSGKEDLEKLVEANAEDAGKSETDAEGSKVSRKLASLEVFIRDLELGGTRTTGGRNGRKLLGVTDTQWMKRERNCIVEPFCGRRGKEATRRNLENETFDERGKREKRKTFPISVRNGTKGVPRNVDGIAPSLRFGGVEGQLVFALVLERGLHTKSGADESDGNTGGNQNVGRDGGFLIPSNETLGDETNESTKVENRIEAAVERGVGEIESIFVFHLDCDGNAVSNGGDVLHAEILGSEVWTEIAGRNDELGSKESVGFLFGSGHEQRVGGRRTHVDHGVGYLGTNDLIATLEKVVDENNGLREVAVVVSVLLVEAEELGSIIAGSREDLAVFLPGASGVPNGGKKRIDDSRLPNARGTVDVKPDGDGSGFTTENESVVLGSNLGERNRGVVEHGDKNGSSLVGKDGLASEKIFVHAKLGNCLRGLKADDFGNVARVEKTAESKDFLTEDGDGNLKGISALGIASPSLNEGRKDVTELLVNPFQSFRDGNDAGERPEEFDEKGGRSAYEMLVGGRKKGGEEA